MDGLMYRLRWVLLVLYGLAVAGPFLLAWRSGMESDVDLFLLAWLGGALVVGLLFILGAGTKDLGQPMRPARLILPVLMTLVVTGLLTFSAYLTVYELFHYSGSDWLGFSHYVPKPGDCASPLATILFAPFVCWIFMGPIHIICSLRLGRYDILHRLTAYLLIGCLLQLVATIPSNSIAYKLPGFLRGVCAAIGAATGVLGVLWCIGVRLGLLFLLPKYEAEQKSADQGKGSLKPEPYSLSEFLLCVVFAATSMCIVVYCAIAQEGSSPLFFLVPALVVLQTVIIGWLRWYPVRSGGAANARP